MTGDLDKFALFTGLFGGLALFLFGMDIMTRSLKRVAGDYMKTLLGKMTNNRFAGVLTGATVTAVIQSSSVTTVLLVGFISAGLMSTSQSVAVIFGANIGTTITAQILAFKVTKLALPAIALGFLVSFTAKREEWVQSGMILLGLGLVFYGMHVMSDAMKPLRSFQPFLDFMISLQNPFLAALVGAAFTAVIQSSSATTGILIVMAGQGLVGLETAIALALGANIGTCATAGLAAIGKPRAAVRAALVHALFNVIGVAVWIGFVGQLGDLARLISPVHANLTGLDRVAAEVPRQIANIHTFFNVVNTALFIGFTTQFTRFVEWAIPDKPLKLDQLSTPKHLDDQLIGTPAIALDAARREIVNMGGLVRDMLAAAIPTATSGSRLDLEKLSAMDKPVDALHRAIIGYLRKLSLENLSTSQSMLLMALIKIANDLEYIGDRVATGLVTSANKRIDEQVVISKATAKVIADLHASVLEALKRAVEALEDENYAEAEYVREMKQGLAEMVENIALHEMARLKSDEPKRLMTYAREIELVETFDDVFKTTRRIARTQMKILDEEAELQDPVSAPAAS